MTPFACDMTALTAEQRQRHQQLGQSLRSSLLCIHEVTEGYEFEFAPEQATFAALGELTSLEHACCPFIDISIRLERAGGKLWWQLSGAKGVKEFIHAEFSAWFDGGPQ